MIADLVAAVAADLARRRFPHPVIAGPERFPRDGFRAAIIFARDPDAVDAIVAPAGANGINPEVPFNVRTAVRCLMFSRSPKPGATAHDHEVEIDAVRDGVLAALKRAVAAGPKGAWQVTESRLLSRDELRVLADVGESDDKSGKRSADWPGRACRLRFWIQLAVRDITYPGAARPEGEIFDVVNTVETSL